MSRRRNGVRKDRVAKLDKINTIDKKIKRKMQKLANPKDEIDKLMSQRRALTDQLKRN